MKTLKILSIAALFTLLAGVTFANTYYETHYEVQSYTDLPTVIKQMVKSDFVRIDNYFNQKNISEMNETVVIEFYVDKDQRIQITSTNSENEEADEYINQLLDNAKINADQSVVNKKYKLKLYLYYKS